MFESDAVAELAKVMVHAAGETLAGLAEFDPAVLDDATVRSTARELELVRRRLDAASCHFLAELHDRQSTEKDAALTTSRWLAREAKLPASAATQRVQTAVKLHDLLPDVDAALREGRIGFDHARVFAQVTNPRNADAMAAASAALCDLAQLMAFGRWRREVHAAAAYADPDGGEPDPNRDHLHLSGTDGLVLLRGELTGDDAITFEHAVNARADELFHQYTREQERFPRRPDPRPSHAACAGARRVVPPSPGHRPHHQPRAEHRRHDHLPHRTRPRRPGHPHRARPRPDPRPHPRPWRRLLRSPAGRHDRRRHPSRP